MDISKMLLSKLSEYIIKETPVSLNWSHVINKEIIFETQMNMNFYYTYMETE